MSEVAGRAQRCAVLLGLLRPSKSIQMFRPGKSSKLSYGKSWAVDNLDTSRHEAAAQHALKAQGAGFWQVKPARDSRVAERNEVKLRTFAEIGAMLQPAAKQQPQSAAPSGSAEFRSATDQAKPVRPRTRPVSPQRPGSGASGCEPNSITLKNMSPAPNHNSSYTTSGGAEGKGNDYAAFPLGNSDATGSQRLSIPPSSSQDAVPDQSRAGSGCRGYDGERGLTSSPLRPSTAPAQRRACRSTSPVSGESIVYSSKTRPISTPAAAAVITIRNTAAQGDSLNKTKPADSLTLDNRCVPHHNARGSVQRPATAKLAVRRHPRPPSAAATFRPRPASGPEDGDEDGAVRGGLGGSSVRPATARPRRPSAQSLRKNRTEWLSNRSNTILMREKKLNSLMKETRDRLSRAEERSRKAELDKFGAGNGIPATTAAGNGAQPGNNPLDEKQQQWRAKSGLLSKGFYTRTGFSMPVHH